MASTERLNIDEPRYDQTTYKGRAKYFFITTNPLNLFTTSRDLEKARDLVIKYRNGTEPANTNIEELWKAKNLYDSAFHPETGDKMMLVGRMSAQVPMNMTLIGCMMTFYKGTPAVLFWQWINQTFNGIVNYTNRSGDHPIPQKTVLTSYLAGTGGALTSALLFNRVVKSMSPLVGRYVPFVAVATANAINIPCMRSRELMHGIPVFTQDGERVGDSKVAAQKAITEVTFSRIFMASPGMLFPPLIMARLEKTFLKRYPLMAAPIQVALVGFCLVFATPLCCALFPQKSSMPVHKLEAHLQDGLKKRSDVTTVYFNKGL